VAPHVPVVDATGRFIRDADADRFADRARTGGDSLTPERLADLDRALDPSLARASAAPTPPAAAAAPVSFARRPWLLARAVSAFLGALVWVGFPISFMVIWVAAGSRDMPLPIMLLPLTVVLPFVVVGADPLLRSLVRFGIARGPETVLTVAPDGITLQETLRIRWGAIAAVRLEGLASGETPDRPRLDIVPRDASLVARRPWVERLWDRSRRALRAIKPFGDRRPLSPTIAVDLHDLDADPDEILDLIDRFRRIEIEG
jgi:hypothetical protein